MVKNGKLCTPPTYTGALHGITAQAVQDLAKKLGYDVEETIITPFQLFNADEVFFTGTASEIIPLREINKRQINDGKPGPTTKRLQAEFAKLIRDPREGIAIYR